MLVCLPHWQGPAPARAPSSVGARVGPHAQSTAGVCRPCRSFPTSISAALDSAKVGECVRHRVTNRWLQNGDRFWYTYQRGWPQVHSSIR